VLKQCVRLCMKLGLIEGNTLFVDGTKIRANAGMRESWSKERCERELKEAEGRIEKILRECDNVDASEAEQDSLVRVPGDLDDAKALREKVKGIVRIPFEEIRPIVQARYQSSAGQTIYARRQSRVEHPFGHIKRNLGVQAFLLRRFAGVRAEAALFATCFNIARIMTLVGVGALLAKLRTS